MQTINTGAAGAFAATNPADPLIDTVYSLKADYRPGARWLISRSTAGAMRKLKDADGNYLWQTSAVVGQPDAFLGFPVTLAEDMPDIAADSLSVAFGNFQRGYVIADHPSVLVLRDALTLKGWVKFYSTRRVGGAVYDFDAIKLVQFSA
ncbi:MAG: HK97 family phage major capsid protein [Gammaproteobacteria bacterium]